MKKNLFRFAAGAIVAAGAVAGLASCNGSGASLEKAYITVGVTQDTGNNFISMKTWLDSVKSELNFEWDYVLMDSRNDANNLTALQNKLNSGTQGIITMTDMAANNLQTLLKNLEANDAYIAGYQTDLTNANKAGLLDNARIVGTVTDGESGAMRGETLFNQVVKSTNRKIVLAQFPSAYFPAVVGATEKFEELAAEYNKTHDDKFTFYSGSGDKYPSEHVYQMTFQEASLADATYDAWKADGVQAVVAVNSLAKRLLAPAAKDTNNPINIYAVGWDDEIMSSFGEDKIIRTQAQTQAETILFPLVQLLNAIRGQKYSDAPTKGTDKVVVGHYIFVTNAADLAAGKQNSMNFSEDHAISRALIDAAGAKALLAGQSGATYAKLKETLDSWNTQWVLYRQK